MQATVSARTTRGALEIARESGLDERALAARHGVAAAFTDLEARFPHQTWLGLWQSIVAHTGDDAVGLRAAERLTWGHFGVIDYLIATSADLGTALARFCRYFAVVSTGVEHSLEQRGEEVVLVRRYAPDCQTRLLAPAEFAFASIVLRTRLAAGAAWRPRSVRFAAPEPDVPEARRRLFDCPVYFGADTSAIVIDAATLALPMKMPDDALLDVLERHARLLTDALAARPDDDGLEARVRSTIALGMRDGDVSLAGAARRFGTSARTFQRRLCEEGLSFDGLLDDVRHALARQYLRDPSLSIKEVCFLLAYEHPRGFYRAFRRWEGSTPADYRANGGRARDVTVAPSAPPSAP